MATLTADKDASYAVGAGLVLMLLLAGATWVVVGDNAVVGLGLDAAVVSILELTIAKIYVVGRVFMEIRGAAPWLTRTFTIWCVSLCIALSAFYLFQA